MPKTHSLRRTPAPTPLDLEHARFPRSYDETLGGLIWPRRGASCAEPSDLIGQAGGRLEITDERDPGNRQDFDFQRLPFRAAGREQRVRRHELGVLVAPPGAGQHGHRLRPDSLRRRINPRAGRPQDTRRPAAGPASTTCSASSPASAGSRVGTGVFPQFTARFQSRCQLRHACFLAHGFIRCSPPAAFRCFPASPGRAWAVANGPIEA